MWFSGGSPYYASISYLVFLPFFPFGLWPISARVRVSFLQQIKDFLCALIGLVKLHCFNTSFPHLGVLSKKHYTTSAIGWHAMPGCFLRFRFEDKHLENLSHLPVPGFSPGRGLAYSEIEFFSFIHPFIRKGIDMGSELQHWILQWVG